jgi:hypothetical protein
MTPLRGPTTAARIRPMTTRRCIPVLAFVALALVVSGCTASDTDPAPVPPATTTTTPSLSEVFKELLTTFCRTKYDAVLTGSSEFVHPTWGLSLLATCLSDDNHRPTVIIVDHDGVPRWAKTTSYSEFPFDHYAPLRPVTDRWGNLFIGYDGEVPNGSGEGVEVLRPTTDGAESVSMNHWEWTHARDGIDQDDLVSVQAFKEHPLFFPAVAIYDGDIDVYRIQVMIDTYRDLEYVIALLDYEWRGSQYELILQDNEWLLPAEAVGSVIDQSHPALWARVTLTGGHARALICSTGRFQIIAAPTCTGTFFHTTHAALEGDLDGNTALLVHSEGFKWNGSQFEHTPGISQYWGILHLDANGAPVGIERPEGSECLLSNGEPFTYPPGVYDHCEET